MSVEAEALNTGDPAPDFSLPTADGDTVTLSALRGHPVIVYFYPRADTPGCTKEANGFTEAMPDFGKVEAQVIGISKDPVAKLAKFRDKYDLKIILASDADSDTTERYGSWVEKKQYGRTYMGIDRSTFLIGPDGTLTGVWRKVKVDGHVAKVLAAATEA